MKTLQHYIDKLNALNFKEMYMEMVLLLNSFTGRRLHYQLSETLHGILRFISCSQFGSCRHLA